MKKNTDELVFFSRAQAELREAVEFLQAETKRAGRYRGREARAFWNNARDAAEEAINFISSRLNPSTLIVADEHTQSSVADALDRMYYGFEVYQDSLSRVHWLVSAAEDLRDRLLERGLLCQEASMVPVQVVQHVPAHAAGLYSVAMRADAWSDHRVPDGSMARIETYAGWGTQPEAPPQDQVASMHRQMPVHFFCGPLEWHHVKIDAQGAPRSPSRCSIPRVHS